MYQSRSNAKRTPSRGYAATPASAKTQQDALFLGSLRPLFGLRSVISNYNSVYHVACSVASLMNRR